MLFAGPQVQAQTKIGQIIKGWFSGNKAPQEEAYEIPIQLLLPREKLHNVAYAQITGNVLDEPFNIIWVETGHVPEIEIFSDDKTPDSYKGAFDIVQYTKRVQMIERGEEEDVEEELDYSEIPEEYNIWTNASINPYNVKLSEMKDTVRIDLSSYTSPGYRYVTSEFGGRWGRLHAGIDLKVFIGDTIYCAFDNGVVRIQKFDRRGYGHYVVVRHENGLETLYGHMSKTLVEEGQSLRAGQAIGLGGSTGRSTGPHLHFELRYLGNPINPRDAIDFNSGKIHDKTLVLTKDNFKYQNIKFSKKSKSSRGKKSASRSKSSGKGKGGSTITVRKGDTLGAIARRHGTTVSKLQKLNGLKGTLIRAGQKLRVR